MFSGDIYIYIIEYLNTSKGKEKNFFSNLLFMSIIIVKFYVI